jgi:hypothetical protein
MVAVAAGSTPVGVGGAVGLTRGVGLVGVGGGATVGGSVGCSKPLAKAGSDKLSKYNRPMLITKIVFRDCFILRDIMTPFCNITYQNVDKPSLADLFEEVVK